MVKRQFSQFSELQLNQQLPSVETSPYYGFMEKEILYSIYPSVLGICSLPSAFVCDLKGIIFRSPKYRIPSSQFSLGRIHTPGGKTLLYFVTANRNPRDMLQTSQNDRQA